MRTSSQELCAWSRAHRTPLPLVAVVALTALTGATCLPGQSLDKLRLYSARAESANYRGNPAIHLTPEPGAPNAESFALVAGPGLRDGTIEADLAGSPATGAGELARGFIGIAFRMAADTAKFELIYLRPTNGRADDQLRRNHSTQYVSFPDWPWQRTRKETPGLYESYVDLEPGAWTKVRVDIAGAKARLFVNNAAQPCLIVNDLKLAPAAGGVALWVGPGTDGYFTNLKVTPQN